jgi:DNA polymerase-3 subunit delta'
MLSEVREQEEAVRFLQRVVDGAIKDPLLLVGPAGTGRRFSVRQAAKQAFGQSAVMIDVGTHPDLWYVEPEPGKELKVDVVRDRLDQAQLHPTLVRDRYFILDGADRMSIPAANALLKTLEEPPPSTCFFLLAERRHDVLPTIRSRCGLVRYNRLSESFITSELQRLGCDEMLALVYARLSNGSLGRATRLYHTAKLALRDRMLGIFKAAVSRNLVDTFHDIDSTEEDLLEGLDFLDHILKDIFLIEYDPSVVTNLDRVSDLRELRHKLGLKKLVEVRTRLRGLSTLPKQVFIPFHFKAALAGALMSG